MPKLKLESIEESELSDPDESCCVYKHRDSNHSDKTTQNNTNNSIKR